MTSWTSGPQRRRSSMHWVLQAATGEERRLREAMAGEETQLPLAAVDTADMAKAPPTSMRLPLHTPLLRQQLYCRPYLPVKLQG